MPVKPRIEAAEALGRAGDPRLRADHFIEVPDTGGVKLGKYPVTVEEFQRFYDHPGYEEPKYWSEAGWSYQQEKSWEAPGSWDEQLLTPSRPVTQVSWFEAEAYCRWLSDQRDETFRLPSEAEWEKAATPSNGKYPWGVVEPNDELANFGMNVEAATPVGIYPKGDGPLGHCDLAGNVWEWCADPDELTDRIWSDDDKKTGIRVLRGGSWVGSADYLRSSYRFRSVAWRRYDSIGFRVAVAPRARSSSLGP